MDGESARKLALADTIDPAEVGFMCGLEIHQQLNTRKLFSPQPSEVVDPDEVSARTEATVTRRLNATQSEMGETDVAAAAETARDRRFRYLSIQGVTSLVELDEEPPHPMSEEALDIALTYAGLLGARPADEVHVMRKTVVDGSNTSGFQRTSLIATGGSVDAEGGDVGIWTIAVEEDSARKLSEEGGIVSYTLDRLGIPLIEVATAPDISSPLHAQLTAARLGGLLRATGRVKRGLGSIRQDLNVSVGVGDRVEIKGCQDLRAVPRVIEAEMRRQLWMHYLAEALRERKATVGDITDVTSALKTCPSKVVASAIKAKGTILALPLEGFAGLIHGASKDGPRLGREFADHAKVAAGVKGVFHSDELPAYGIRDEDVSALQALVGHAFVLCAAPKAQATRALQAVAARAVAAMGPPAKEVRAAQPDDSSRYMRPLPGAARMYPETDVPPIRISPDHWKQVCANLPARPEEVLAELVADGLSKDLAEQLQRDDLVGTYRKTKGDRTLVARTLLDAPPSTHGRIEEVVAAVGELFAKEAIPDVMAQLSKGPEQSLADAAAAAGAVAADTEEVDAVIDRVLAEREAFVKERGMAAMGPIMGPIMAELRGKADGQVISERLKAKLQSFLA